MIARNRLRHTLTVRARRSDASDARGEIAHAPVEIDRRLNGRRRRRRRDFRELAAQRVQPVEDGVDRLAVVGPALFGAIEPAGDRFQRIDRALLDAVGAVFEFADSGFDDLRGAIVLLARLRSGLLIAARPAAIVDVIVAGGGALVTPLGSIVLEFADAAVVAAASVRLVVGALLAFAHRPGIVAVGEPIGERHVRGAVAATSAKAIVVVVSRRAALRRTRHPCCTLSAGAPYGMRSRRGSANLPGNFDGRGEERVNNGPK